jgi:DNA-binding response OmpR family regulator
MRVLIVDDYPGLIELYDLGLAARGFEVVGAATAGEALSLAANEAFDAVVLDLQLPDASGSDLLRRLRNLPSLDGKPIVGISSFESRDAHADAFDAFLEKPLHPKKLASVLRRLLDRDRRISA